MEIATISLLLLLIYIQREQMAKIDEVKAAVSTTKADLAAAIDRVAVDVAELKRLAEQGNIPDAEFDAVINELATISTSLKALDPVPEFPATEPPPVV